MRPSAVDTTPARSPWNARTDATDAAPPMRAKRAVMMGGMAISQWRLCGGGGVRP